MISDCNYGRSVKICFFSGDFSRSGGTERVGSIIANALSEAGYPVAMLSFWNGGQPFFHLNEKVKLYYLLSPKTEGKLYRTYIYPIVKLHRFIKKNKIDIIIDIDTELARFTSYAIQRTKCRQISWEHFNYWTMLKLNEKKRFKAKELIKKSASKLVVLTEEDRKKHIAEYKLDPNFVVTMPNPCISNVTLAYNYNHKTFLAVGRLTPQKKIDALLDAWNLIQDKCPEWKVVIVGKGELEVELKQYAENLHLKRIVWAGHTKHVEEYYEKAACYVLSSDYEGFPMVILEAQSYGLPVISFDCKTGPRDLVLDGINGYLVEDGNVKQLAERMLKFTQNEKNALIMSAEATNNVQKYNLETITTKWINLIDEVEREEKR